MYVIPPAWEDEMATRVVKSHGAAHVGHESSVGTGFGHYSRFATMVGLSFLAMYVLMYAMVDSFSSVYGNVNQVYMAGLMAAPMAIVEILVMSAMYPNRKANAVILIASIVALIFFYFGMRTQLRVGDRQVLRSMIPHHSGAILMCKKAKFGNPKIRDLCQNILRSQSQEIDQMKAILSENSGRQSFRSRSRNLQWGVLGIRKMPGYQYGGKRSNQLGANKAWSARPKDPGKCVGETSCNGDGGIGERGR